MFICFTGIDGAGKSTLARGLVYLLNNRGVNCRYVYARHKAFILKPFILMGRLLFLRGENQFEDYSRYYAIKRKAIKNHPLLSRIYRQIFWLDYIIQLLSEVKLPLLLDKNIVCDRYIYDTVITDLAVDMNYSEERISSLLHRLFCFLPKPDITFLVDLPEETASNRKDDIPSVEYLKERRKIYMEVGKAQKMYILDGAKELEDLKCEIITAVLHQAQL